MGYPGEAFGLTVLRKTPNHYYCCNGFANYAQSVFICRILYSVTLLFVKASILMDWARVFVPAGTRNTFFWTCYILLWVNVLYYTAIVIASNLACTPREKIWDPTVPGGKCTNLKVSLVVSSTSNVVSDILILLLPQNIIWRLQMPLKRKIGVSLIFVVGIM